MSKRDGFGILYRGDTRCVVQLASNGPRTWRLEHLFASDEGELVPDHLLRDAQRAGGNLAWLLPEDDVTCSQTPLPRLKGKEMARAVKGWVARQEGGEPDDWRVSWHAFPLPSGAEDAQQVALVYGFGEDLDGQAAAAERLGLTPGLMLPPSLILDQFFRMAAPESSSLRVWNLVFVGGKANVLCVANQDGLLLTRPLPGNLADGDEEEYIDRLATEIERSLFFARQNAGSPQVDGVFICGDTALASRLQARLRESGGTPCQHWALEQAIDCGGRQLDADQQILAMAAALATWGAQYNLAPRARRGLLGERGRRRLAVSVGTVAVASVPLLIVGGLLTGRVQEGYLHQARQDLIAATERAEAAAEIYDRQRVLDAREEYLARHRAARHDLEGVLRDLAGAAPASVRFRELQLFEREGGLILQLTGTSLADQVSRAQEGFMAFHEAVRQLPRVEPLSEPRQLQIGVVDDDRGITRSVLFTLECRLCLAMDVEEG